MQHIFILLGLFLLLSCGFAHAAILARADIVAESFDRTTIRYDVHVVYVDTRIPSETIGCVFRAESIATAVDIVPAIKNCVVQNALTATRADKPSIVILPTAISLRNGPQ